MVAWTDLLGLGCPFVDRQRIAGHSQIMTHVQPVVGTPTNNEGDLVRPVPEAEVEEESRIADVLWEERVPCVLSTEEFLGRG